MTKTIHFNTGRKYSPKGQRITATRYEDDGRTTFYDHDRMIAGELTIRLANVIFLNEGSIMGEYDAGRYDNSAEAHSDAFSRGGINSVWKDKPKPVVLDERLYLTVAAIYRLTEQATSPEHSGRDPFVNTDFPIGTLVAVGLDDTMFSPSQEAMEGLYKPSETHILDASIFTRDENGRIRLWRDHWRLFSGTPISAATPREELDRYSPYVKSVLLAAKDLVAFQSRAGSPKQL